MLVIGGLGTIIGPFIGTAIVVIVETLLVSHPGVELTVVGVFLLVVVVFAPGGLVPLFGQLLKRVSRWADEGKSQERVPANAAVASKESGGDAEKSRESRAP
jgi:branched-chain amino acid transport system permease protein